MDSSVFTDKSKPPQPADLAEALGPTHALWQELYELVYTKYPRAIREWYFPGTKWGWNFRIKDRKRTIVYLLPRDRHFLAAFVFGKRAYEAVMESTVSKDIKDNLQAARPYAEGRGIRIEVKDEQTLKDLDQLIRIKLAH